jgi:hypothetical protein
MSPPSTEFSNDLRNKNLVCGAVLRTENGSQADSVGVKRICQDTCDPNITFRRPPARRALRDHETDTRVRLYKGCEHQRGERVSAAG